MKTKLTNLTLNVLRGLLSIPGIAKTSGEVYQDGELLCVTLPELDMSWVKSEREQMLLPTEKLKEYLAQDKAWSETPVEVELTEKQRDRIKAVMAKAPELANLPQSKGLFALYKEFGVGIPA